MSPSQCLFFFVLVCFGYLKNENKRKRGTCIRECDVVSEWKNHTHEWFSKSRRVDVASVFFYLAILLEYFDFQLVFQCC